MFYKTIFSSFIRNKIENDIFIWELKETWIIERGQCVSSAIQYLLIEYRGRRLGWWRCLSHLSRGRERNYNFSIISGLYSWGHYQHHKHYFFYFRSSWGNAFYRHNPDWLTNWCSMVPLPTKRQKNKSQFILFWRRLCWFCISLF